MVCYMIANTFGNSIKVIRLFVFVNVNVFTAIASHSLPNCSLPLMFIKRIVYSYAQVRGAGATCAGAVIALSLS